MLLVIYIVAVGSRTVFVLLTLMHCHDYVIIMALFLVIFFNITLVAVTVC